MVRRQGVIDVPLIDQQGVGQGRYFDQAVSFAVPACQTRDFQAENSAGSPYDDFGQ